MAGTGICTQVKRAILKQVQLRVLQSEKNKQHTGPDCIKKETGAKIVHSAESLTEDGLSVQGGKVGETQRRRLPLLLVPRLQ